MPYDPDWQLDGDEIGYTAAANSGEYSEYSDQAAEQLQDEGNEEHGEAGEEDDMDVDLPQPSMSKHSESDHDATPRNPRPATAVAPVGRPSQVAVVLHSSPRKDDFRSLADDTFVDDEDHADLVTSDIVPKPKSKRPESVAASAAVIRRQEEPAASSVPFPLPTITPQPKKRGRPFGWRLGSGPYSAMTGGTPSSTPRPKPKKPASEQKQRGRPGRKPAPTARQVYLKLNPRFVAFRCEWENCPAELQNLETLRKHLLIVHGRLQSSPRTRPARSTPLPHPSPPAPDANPVITCKWAACSHPAFTTQTSFASHIEEAHLPSFLWHVGDGPRNTSPFPAPLDTATTKTSSTEAPLPAYLFDAKGVQVTPSVRDQVIENDVDFKKRQAMINRMLRRRDANAPEEPDYTADQLAEISAVMSEKKAKQRMFRDYAERVCGIGGRAEAQEGGAVNEWRGLMV